ncbi:MAG TPA: hypothetical protein VD931_16615 [Baekduia sp.]|nr:hypothetical protein [Baekduia sp.]
MPPVLRRFLVPAIAAAGVALLGSSVQGIAAVGDDLDAAARQHHVRDGVKKDCPRERDQQRRQTSDLRS